MSNKLVQGKIEKAVSDFEAGLCCSQAVLAGYAEQFGLQREKALKLSSAFGGGIAKLGGICGAVTGAFMVLGLRYGHTTAGETAARERTHEVAREFVRRFEARNGSTICRELLGFDMSTEEGMEAAKKPGSFDRCPQYVRDAMEILEEMLDR